MRLLLDKKWKIKRLSTGDIYERNIPCSILSLLREENILDPYYRDNEKLALKYLEEDYELSKEIDIDKELLTEENILLTIQIDTIGIVLLNEVNILQTKNMHRIYEVDIKNFLKPDKNELKIILKSPIKYITEKQKQLPLYGVKEAIAGYPHLRKAHFMFGWDWGAQLPDMGIYHPPEIKAFSTCKIKNLKISQQHSKKRVNLNFELGLEKFSSKNLYLFSKISSPSGAEFFYEQEINSKNINWEIEIDNPFLWWPSSLGKQYLYEVELTIKDKDKIIDSLKKKVGLRKVELIRQKDKIGESFFFRINEKEIFIKGANYIPEDHILPFTNRQRTRKLLSDCLKANFNTIRIWGGGYYLPDYFYELCDELGILIWHDFMFACSQYPPDKEFIEEVAKEIEYNVERLKHHPSIILWCGNNEVEEAWVYWGIPQKNHLKKTYLKIFEKLIPSILKKVDKDRPYWPSSPSTKGNFYKPREETAGDSHYWAVWHGLKPFEDYKYHNFRFVSEFGFQSFPSIKTINSFTEEEDRNIFSYVMEKHQKNSSANGKIIYYLSENYLFPKDFKSLVYLSQLLQAEAIKYGVKHFRIKSDICRGAIYWQLNDCWPVASWSSIDYYGRWKALHYYAKKFFSPIMLASDIENNLVKIYLLNDNYEEQYFTFKFKISTFSGTKIYQTEKNVKTPPFGSQLIFEYFITENVNPREIYIDFGLYSSEVEIYRDFDFLTKPKHFIWSHPAISLDFTEDENFYQIILKTDNFAKNVEIDFESYDIILSDNYFDIPSEETKTVYISKSEYKNLKLTDIKKDIKIFSLHDSFKGNKL
ncbi:MAG: hypothetical protein N2258_05115 [Brevinematales bacterium]|nr:hypothetical protein [Brevinematales bacterium]